MTISLQHRSLPEALHRLVQCLPVPSHLRLYEPLKWYTTLRVGGPADLFYRVTEVEEFAQVVIAAHQLNVPTFILGLGSNLLVSDKGIRGLVVYNCCRRIEVGEVTFSESGASFQQLFLKTAQAGLSGLEFAVGIPGTVGGALVSNAGAFRENICDLVETIDVVVEGERKQVTKEWMQFSYRDSILRRPNPPRAAILAVTLRLRRGDRWQIFAKARELQRWRIERQPPNPSAGSFFKNVYDAELAQRLPTLPPTLKEAGVVPAGYLIAEAGLKGLRVGGAMVSQRHANFLINAGGATARDLRQLADIVKQRVYERFGVWLEEEVLTVGEWDEAAEPDV
ncbi:MAG: UDP-N-acetylmuramate dehydrogenase [Armatimonadetes bacterium]|nr:UDP-N-acetylmuramate dehydrogenase [Armatimonadota bacterium]